MRALITGITGQDGWYLAELLRAQGTELFGLVAAGDDAQLPAGVRAIEGDMRDAASLRAAVEQAEPDQVYNLASISSVAFSWREPELVADVNGLGVLRLLTAVRDWQATAGREVHVVQASSAEVFGCAAPPQNEDTPIAPTTPYGAAKAYAQHVVRTYRAAGLRASSVILYNHESPRRPPEFVTRKITQAVARIADGRDERLALGSLTSRRDWGYAPDYVAAMALVAARDEPDDFVVATGISHTVGDFVAAAFAAVGIEDWAGYVDLDPAFQRAGDSGEQRGDATRARAVLGWAPTVSFEELVALLVAHDRRELG